MSVNLVAVTASAGVPLFTRNICLNKPNEECIPFATLAALNGVNLFSRLNAYNLMSASTTDAKIWWKLYKGSIVLILIATTDTESTFSHSSNDMLSNLLDLIFDMASQRNDISKHGTIEKIT
ncbi:protein fuzzy-like protein, partial [Leptotrombidium deliense]